MKNKKTKLSSLFIICIILFFVLIYLTSHTNTQYFQQPTNSSATSKNESNTFYSKTLRFNVNIQPKFNIEEKIVDVFLIDRETSKKIIIGRTATNFINSDEYVKDLSQRNKFILVDKETMKINNLDSISGEIQYNSNNKEKIYFIYSDGWVYTLSTDSPELYDDLDAIAQSFRYVPD